MNKTRFFTALFVVLFLAFILADIGSGQRPTGTATPIATPTPNDAITTPTVTAGNKITPPVKYDYYKAKWGRKGNPGTEKRPFPFNHPGIRGKVTFLLLDAETNRIVNGR